MNSAGVRDQERVRSSSPCRSTLPALALIAATLVVFIVLFVFNPNEHGFYPRCGFHALTGWDCPGCGGLRAAHQLLHGQVAAAWRLNPLVTMAPLFITLLVMAWRAWPGGFARSRGNWAAWVVIALIFFGVARNLSRL